MRICYQMVISCQEVAGMKFERIKNIRVDMDLSQKDIGQVLHCQREVYRRYECGQREIPISYAMMLADYYGVSLDYLVGRSDNKEVKFSKNYNKFKSGE